MTPGVLIGEHYCRLIKVEGGARHDGRYALTHGYAPDLSKEVGAPATAADTPRKHTIY